MDDIIGVVIAAIGWLVFRAISSGAKRQEQARREGQRGQPRNGQAYPTQPKKTGGWAEMLGNLSGASEGSTLGGFIREVESAFGGPKPTPIPENIAPTPPPAPSAQVPAPVFGLEGYVSPEGMDDCHDYMLGAESPFEADASVLSAGQHPNPGLRLDAPALVQGVIFAEILTRPAQRRRAGTWQRR